MLSKKDMLTLGVLAIGGVAVASSFAGGGGDIGALEGKKGRAGGILGSQQGYGAAPTYGASPTIYNLPAAAPVTFPEAPTFDISKFFTPIVEPTVSRGAAGVSAEPKKYKETGKVGLGYAGYVTPKIPTPIAPPYVPGVTTFVPYKEPGYVPSPVKKYSSADMSRAAIKERGYLGTGMTQSEHASQYAGTLYAKGSAAPKKTPSDASKAISHAKRLRAGRGD
jgi:hypothetical protein